MPLSWNEIRHRAIAFSKDWTGAKREQAEKQTFWNEFFNVFSNHRTGVKQGYLFNPGPGVSQKCYHFPRRYIRVASTAEHLNFHHARN